MTDLSYDDAWLAEPRTRSRLRAALVVALLAALVFLGGVQVQQHWGSAAAAAGPAGGMPAGMAGMRGAAPGGNGQDVSDSGGTGQGLSDSGTTATAAAPAVIGTVTAADGATWTVTDLGGTAHQVTVPDGLQVPAGTTVSITGEADAQGVVAATAVTVRPTSTDQQN
jgi:hypothetical protein